MGMPQELTWEMGRMWFIVGPRVLLSNLVQHRWAAMYQSQYSSISITAIQ